MYLQNEGVSRHETLQLFLFLSPLQHMKRPALQNKQAGVLRMAFRARKAFGSFEKRAPVQNLTRRVHVKTNSYFYVSWCSFYLSFIREFWHQRRERQRQRHKLRIWLVECGKIIVLHVRHALMNKSVPSSAKQQREITIYTVLMNTWAYNR